MATSSGTSATVMVADDDPLVRTVLRMALSTMGHSVIEARSTRDVVTLPAELDVDLVILDVHMPGGEASESVAALRGRDRAPRILLMSGDAAGDLPADVDAFIRKPVDLSALTAVIEELLAPRASRGDHAPR
jgi:two-component system, OmpR family, response regulator